MPLKLIKTEIEYQEYLDRIDSLLDAKVSAESLEGEQLQVLLLLIKQYEDIHYPIPFPDPVDAIKQKMLDKGIKNKDFIGKIGSKGYISALLNKKKPLTLEIAKIFHKELGIPAEILLS